jgi:3-mercaptopyruvate sulfurtransferase SseA
VAAKLRQHGFTRIRPLLGGLDAWIDAGLPVDGADGDQDGGAGSAHGADAGPAHGADAGPGHGADAAPLS